MLYNCNGAIDYNSCAEITIGSPEGLAQIQIHPLSHEATFNRESILAWEKGRVGLFYVHFIFIFFY